ncbi:MAG TPA: cystathionine beta-lyase, partial [Paludibacteraceae bacterium]|nr:cystathionine beta-lyase [Paludibacteraceae bacterium]
MLYDFDEIIDRKGTDSVKVDGAKFLWHRDDLLPLWVADMDFR